MHDWKAWVFLAALILVGVFVFWGFWNWLMSPPGQSTPGDDVANIIDPPTCDRD